MDNQPVSFPNWKEALAEAALAPVTKAAYGRAIISFLKHCKVSRALATTALAKQYLASACAAPSTNPPPLPAASPRCAVPK